MEPLTNGPTEVEVQLVAESVDLYTVGEAPPTTKMVLFGVTVILLLAVELSDFVQVSPPSVDL